MKRNLLLVALLVVGCSPPEIAKFEEPAGGSVVVARSAPGAAELAESAEPQPRNVTTAAVVGAPSALKFELAALHAAATSVWRERRDQAAALSAAGKHREAAIHCAESIEIVRRRFGDDHPALAAVHHEHADALIRSQRLPDARDAAKRATEIYLATLGERQPATASAFGRLAHAQALLKDPAAIDSMDRSRRIMRRFTAELLPSFAEQDRIEFMATYDRLGLEQAVSFAMDSTLVPFARVGVAAGWFLNGKGAAAEAAQGLSWANRDEASRAMATKLRETQQRLIGLVIESQTEPSTALRRAEIARLETEEATLQRTLSAQSGRNTPRWIEADEVLKALPPRTVFVEVIRVRLAKYQDSRSPYRNNLEDGAERYIACLFVPDGSLPNKQSLEITDLGPTAEADEAIAKIHRDMATFGIRRSTQGEGADELRVFNSLQSLQYSNFRSLVQTLGDHHHWIIAPDSELWLLPWSALLLQSGRYVLQEHTVSVITSGRELLTQRSRIGDAPPAVVGYPNYDLGLKAAPRRVKMFAELPGTKREVQRILPDLAKLTGKKPTELTGDDATEANVKRLKRPSTLVFSTHGFYLAGDGIADANPLARGGLALAGANRGKLGVVDGDNGILTGVEVASLDLRGTRLAVLSACETGLGEVRHGEGVAGLRHAFQLAGVETVLSTLWSIPDQETAVLMDKFFEHYAADEDPATALREAQLAVIDDRRKKYGGAHPIFWGAFHVASPIPPLSTLTIRDVAPKSQIRLRREAIVPLADGTKIDAYAHALGWLDESRLLVINTDSNNVYDIDRPLVVRYDGAGLAQAFAVSSVGSWFTSHGDGRHYFWEEAPGTVAGVERRALADAPTYIRNAKFSDDGTQLVFPIGKKMLRIVRVDEPGTVVDVACDSTDPNFTPFAAFSPDCSRILVTVDSKRLRLIAAKTGATVAEWNVETAARSIQSACFTADGKQVVVSCEKQLRLHDVATGAVVREYTLGFDAFYEMVRSPDGRSFAGCTSVTSKATPALVFDFDKSEPVQRLEGLGTGSRSIAFSPDGRRIAAAGGTKGARVWKLERTK